MRMTSKGTTSWSWKSWFLWSRPFKLVKDCLLSRICRPCSCVTIKIYIGVQHKVKFMSEFLKFGTPVMYLVTTSSCLNNQASFLLATLIHNWHKPLYSKRGGKHKIKASVLRFGLHALFHPAALQVWACDEATKLRAMLGHLHMLAKKSTQSRLESNQQ